MDQQSVKKIIDYVSGNDACKDITIKKEEDLLYFTLDSLHFVCDFNTNDAYYFQIFLPRVLKKEETNEAVLRQALVFNNRYKVAKFILEDNTLWLAAECFITAHEDVLYLFERLTRILSQMIHEFKDWLNENNK